MQINPLAFASDGVKKVIETLERHQPDSVRLVGGCVRDAILNRPVADIDFATPVTPDVVTEIFTKAGFNVEPTGIEHGTVTVIWNHEPFEVTTLRRDVETDGRRAVVEFATDWAEDAFRRDFTFNALYLAPNGTVHDYNGGIADAQNRLVRFMGDAEQRIREDYLRILRMFRFQSVLNATLDEGALEAAKKLKDGIDTLSGERLEKEVIKLLNGEGREDALGDMLYAGVFEKIFGWAPPAIMDILFRLEAQKEAHQNGVNIPPLSVVMAWNAEATESMLNRWKSSGQMRSLILNPIKAGPVDIRMPAETARALTHQSNVGEMLSRIELSWVMERACAGDTPIEALEPLKAVVQSTPRFPLQGRDVLDLGVKPGRVVGEILRGVEERWALADFPMDPEVVHKMLRAEVNRVVYS